MRPFTLCALLAALAAAPARAQQPAATPGAPAAAGDSMPSVTLPPALDRVLRNYERAWGARDAAALAALFAEDGFVMQGGRPPVRGRAAIRATYEATAGGALRLRAFAFATSGDLGYILGGYTYPGSAGDVGKFTLTLRRARDGQWLIMSDMDNPNRRGR